MDFVAQLKSSLDIVKVIGEYVRLKKSSASRYVGLCPFHSEKTASFSVHQGHQFYKCFGCDAKGDVLKFVMEIERISFYEALRLLAERNGIEMPKRAEYSDPDPKLRAAVHSMHEIAERVFRENLASKAGAEARAYLDKRGVSHAAAEHFALGYSGRGALTKIFEKQGFTGEQIEASGLLLKNQEGGYFDRFRNRLMFPIHDESGKPIAFGGRALDPGENAKYLNSPETPIYRKSLVLYNLHRAKDTIRKGDRAILVEGYMDVIGVYASGVTDVVASCGTALTSQQVQTIRRHASRIVVNFDPDNAGSNAAERSIQLLLAEGLLVKILQLDGGLDPDEYCLQRGADAYRDKLEKAGGYFHWLADRARGKYDMRSAEGRVAAFQFLLPAIQGLAGKIERMTVANDVAGYLGVDAGLVLENFRKAASERRETAMRAAPVESVRPVERILLNLLLSNPAARERIVPALRSLDSVSTFVTRRVFQSLFALYDANPSFVFGELEARLEEKDQPMLHAALRDETGADELSIEQGLACLRNLESAQREVRRAELKQRVKEAERAGDLAGALRLAEELSSANR
ncbi:MAG: DNA primase [Bryobacterales bacterium]|nr:DNA primase [Bryobacterales bacterium]